MDNDELDFNHIMVIVRQGSRYSPRRAARKEKRLAKLGYLQTAPIFLAFPPKCRPATLSERGVLPGVRYSNDENDTVSAVFYDASTSKMMVN